MLEFIRLEEGTVTSLKGEDAEAFGMKSPVRRSEHQVVTVAVQEQAIWACCSLDQLRISMTY